MESLMNCVSLRVTYSGGKSRMLQLQSHGGYTWLFSDVMNGLRVKLSLQTQDGTVYVLRMETISPSSDCFASDCAFTVLLQDFPTGNYFSNHLVGEYWCRPFFGENIAECPADTQALLLRRKEGAFYYLLAACDAEYKSIMSGAESGLEIKVFSGDPRLRLCNACLLFLAEGTDPFKIAESCTAYGLEQLHADCLPKAQRVYPAVLEYLGWCTWDAFHIRVNAQGVLEKCAELQEQKIPIRWVLLDDMWADVPGLNDIPEDCGFLDMLHAMQKCSLHDFEADKKRFPTGLQHCIEQIKTRFGLQVGVWHPTTGYWHGIQPDGVVAKALAEMLITVADGQLIHGAEYEQAFAFYDAFHAFLEACGTDFVKVDNQGFLAKYYRNILPVGRAARNVHRAIDASAERHFNGALINCMGMPVESWWNRPHSAVARCSGDFMPEDHAWFIRHLLQCAYNSYVQGTLMYCDWDMWWTDDSQALRNAVLHAISGGPVYISDPCGRSKADILAPLVFQDGRILRCDRPAMPTADCLTVDPQHTGAPLKLWTVANGCGVLCALNLDAQAGTVQGAFVPHAVFGDMAEEYLLYDAFSHEARTVGKYTEIPLQLRTADDLGLFILIPLREGITPIGLTDKWIAPKSIVAHSYQSFTLYEGGICKFFTRDPVTKVFVNGKAAHYHRAGNIYTIDCTGIQQPLIEVK